MEQCRLCTWKVVFVVYVSSISQIQPYKEEELTRGVGVSAPPEQKKPAKHRPSKESYFVSPVLTSQGKRQKYTCIDSDGNN